MDFEGQQEPQEPQEEGQQEPQQAEIDPRVAIEIAARQFGVTPDQLESTIRLQDENRRVYEENRRRIREIEAREAKADALIQDRQRYAPAPPTYDDVDPVTRRVLERLDRIDQREEQRARDAEQQRQHQEVVTSTARELERHYLSAMRGVPSQNQVDQDRFFDAMGEIYPTSNGRLPEGITPEKAVFFTAKYLGLNPSGMGNSYSPQPNMNPMTNRRAPIVIPGGQSGPGPAPQQGFESASQRQGESLEDYSKRLVLELERRQVRGLRDGQRVVSS